MTYDAFSNTAVDTPIKVELPVSRDGLQKLRAGNFVLLSGVVYTMRDAGHKRALEYLHQHGQLPFGLDGQTLFYAGPTPAAAGRALGSVGPTTSSRMDFAAPTLFEAGIVATLGKGNRSADVCEACKNTKSVHFTTVGGIAALLATHVVAAKEVAWQDLGAESLRKLEILDFPAYVAIDTLGNNIFDQVAKGEAGDKR